MLDSPYLKPALVTALIALFFLLETYIPHFLGRTHRLRHAAVNLALALLNAALLALLLAALVVTAAEWAASHHFGLLRLFPLPDYLHFLLALLLFDCWMYLWHRINHRVPFLWRFHAVHHTDDQLDSTSALRFHAGEIILSTLARAAVVPLLGMTVNQLLLYEIILQPVIFFHHANINLPARLDRALRLLIVTPRMHWVHHSNYQPETDSNYASILSIWDRLFRSFRLRRDPATLHLGLDHFTPHEARDLGPILSTPFTHRFERPRSSDHSNPVTPAH